MNGLDPAPLRRLVTDESMAAPPPGPAPSAAPLFLDDASASALDTLERIQSAGGNDGLRAYLDQLPTEQLQALLAASEIRALSYSRHQQLYQQSHLDPRHVSSRQGLSSSMPSALGSAYPSSSLLDPRASSLLMPSHPTMIRQAVESLAAPRRSYLMHPLENPTVAASSSYSTMPSSQTMNLQVHTSAARESNAMAAAATPGSSSSSVSHLHSMTAASSSSSLPREMSRAAAASSFSSRASSITLDNAPRTAAPSKSNHATLLAVESDATFLDPVHTLLRRDFIEVFVSSQDDMTDPGRGARPTRIGQVGLRCIHCRDAPRGELERQAVCFPNRKDTLFEAVRNYQRTHLDACNHVPKELKDRYKRVMQADSSRKRSQKVLKTYYAEAASDLGIVDTAQGLSFGAPPNETGAPSERLAMVIRAAESPTKFDALYKASSSYKTNEAIEMRKFEHVASEGTRRVLVHARKEPSDFVLPQDYPTTSDYDYLLFHQVCAYRPTPERLAQKGVDATKYKSLCGLCCKHCCSTATSSLEGHGSHHRGVYLPTDLASLAHSSFGQTLLNHLMSCPNVPQEIKDAFDELKQLAAELGVATKRGSKRSFFGKIWGRMEKYYE